MRRCNGWMWALVAAVAILIAASTGFAPAAARDGAKPPRIVMILWRGETEVEHGFRDQIRVRGFDAEVIVRDLNRDLSRLPGVLEEVRGMRPDLVYTWGTGITLGTVGRWDGVDAQRNLTDIPVVFVMVSAPLATGVQPPPGAPARPNVTGVSHIAPLAAQINAIRAYLSPKMIGIVYNPAEPNSVSNVADLRSIAMDMGFSLLEAPVPMMADGNPDPASIPGLVDDLAKRGAQVLYIGPDNFVGGHRDTLTTAGIANGIPCFTATELEVRRGEAMFGLVSPYPAVGRLAAEKAIGILLDGKSPASIPMETLERFSYIIRLPVALRLKLYPPIQLIDFAEVIR